jgi:nitrite reductase/ring-hydroxylating ferredoxin subunit
MPDPTTATPLSRRAVIKHAGLAAAALAGLSACTNYGAPTAAPSSAPATSAGAGATQSASGGATETASGRATQTASGGATESAGGLAKTSEIPVGSGKIFPEVQTVITQPTAGEFKAFTSICTHQQCPVVEVTDTINCKCHGSKFSITDGSVVSPPAPSPLAAKAVTVDGDTIRVA